MERRTVDLHMHSSYSSDGTYTIKELFKQARENQMEVIVVADHDTCEGSEEALCEAERTGIYTMPALELSCVDENRMVHILAYGIETGRKTRLLELTEAIQQSRIDILPKIRSNLEREGFYVDMDRVEELAAPHPPVITNFANAILEDKRNEGCPALEPYRPGGALYPVYQRLFGGGTEMLCPGIPCRHRNRDPGDPQRMRGTCPCPSGRMVHAQRRKKGGVDDCVRTAGNRSVYAVSHEREGSVF